MQRSLLLVFFCGVIPAILMGQGYTFSAANETFSPLENATDLTEGQPWNNLQFKVPLDYGFEFYGEVFDTLYIRGYVHFDASDTYFINSFGVLFADRGNSPVLYKVEGNAGARITKIEWRNMGFWAEGFLAGTLQDYVSLQLWLHEGTNTVSVHIGPSSVVNPDTSYYGKTGPAIGVYHIKQYIPEFLIESLSLGGDPAKPEAIFNDHELNVCLSGTPADGAAYKFSYIPGGYSENVLSQVSVYPNPAGSVLFVNYEKGFRRNVELFVFSSDGKRIDCPSRLVNDHVLRFDVAGLNQGLYLIRILSGGEALQARFLKH
ncbi:MAG: T9SS type A sorting domain-containing protein [Bacteroidales bacterium]|nr:T9SS type A sorting domain-containing protein [Bacteroidales bacterium]